MLPSNPQRHVAGAKGGQERLAGKQPEGDPKDGLARTVEYLAENQVTELEDQKGEGCGDERSEGRNLTNCRLGFRQGFLVQALGKTGQDQGAGDLKDHAERHSKPEGNAIVDNRGIAGKSHQKPERNMAAGVEQKIGQGGNES